MQKVVVLIIAVVALLMTGCMGGASGHNVAPKQNVAPPEMDNSLKKAEYEELGKKISHLDTLIEGLDQERIGLQMERIKPIGGGLGSGNPAGKSANGFQHASDLEGRINDFTAQGDMGIERTDWQYESVLNQIEALKKEKNELERTKDRILAESTKSCFPKDTKILLANGKSVRIDSINPNDEVMIYDIAKDAIGSSKVREVYISDNNHMYRINNTLSATAYERFLTRDRGWLKIRDIKEGDAIFNGNTYEIVKHIDKVFQHQAVYNLNIDSTHNFFASNQGNEFYLIHNSGGGGGGK